MCFIDDRRPSAGSAPHPRWDWAWINYFARNFLNAELTFIESQALLDKSP